MTLAAQRARARRLLDDAQARLADSGHDPAFVVACALERLAEAWVDDARPLCPSCGARRLTRTSDGMCWWCNQRVAATLAQKRDTWARHGAQYKATQRAKRPAGG